MRFARTFVLATGSAAVLIALAGCAGGKAGPSAPGTPGSTPTASASPSPTPAANPLITIDAPAAGATVSVPITASGTANTFEAALTVEARDASGDRLCVRSISATSGSGTPGTWRTTLAFPPPDAATAVTLRAYELSAKDGSIINLVERDVTVAADRPAIFITSPRCGAEVVVGETLRVTGRAEVFEAQFTIELRDASGKAVVTQQATAAAGQEESDFAQALRIPADLAPGLYDLVAFDNSAKDGSIIDEFSIQIVAVSFPPTK